MSQIAVSVETGEKVLFRKYGGDKIEREGHELMLIRESDLLAVLND
jgi:co-chaperonin GroES (HSP10)